MLPSKRTTTYQICIKGHLNERWLAQFEDLGFLLSPEGQTIIQGELDQAALHGILNRIRDLGLEIISIQSISIK